MKVRHSERRLSGKVHSAAFDNGLKVFAMRKAEAPAATVQAWVSTGSVDEGERLGCGLSHFLEHMLFQGTAKHPGSAAADAIHRLGGDMNAYTSHNCTVYYASLPSREAATAVDILADMLQAPAFPKEKFKLEKEVILRERDMNRDRPERVIAEKLWLEMFLVHPVRHPIIGYREKIESVDRDMMLSYYKLRYSPSRSFFVIVGDIDPEAAIGMVRERAASWPMGRIDDAPLPPEPAQTCRRLLTAQFRDPLARVSAGWKIPDASHPDIPALDMFTSILGGSNSSRLYKALKTEMELAINISSFNYAPNFPGAAGFAATCNPDKLSKLVEESVAAVERMRAEGVSPQELRRNVNQQVADYLRGLRSNSGVARMIGSSVMTYGSPDFADSYVERLETLTAEDVDRVARDYFDESGLTVIELVPEGFSKKRRSPSASKREKDEPSLRTAPGGQRVVHFRDRSLPLVDVCATLPGGLIWEPSELSGISRLLASTLMSGTGRFSETELAEFLDNEAIDFSAAAGNNTLTFRLNCRKESLAAALKAFASVLSEPLFPERPFARERGNFLETLKSRKATPQSVAEDALCEALYGRHPYSRPSGGAEETIEAATAEAARKFYFDNCLQAGKAVFSVAGDIDADEAFDKMAALFEGCPWSSKPAAKLPHRPSFPAEAVKRKLKLDKEQAVVIKGMPSCDNLDPDRNALDMLHAATNSQSSRLFKTVRDDAGLAYYTGLVYSSGLHEGYLAYYAGTHPGTAAKVESLIEKERARLAKSGLDKEEFEAARACVLHDIAEEMQNAGRLAFNAAVSEFYGLGFMSPWTKAQDMSSLAFKEANAVISKRLSSPSQVSIVVSP